jgi:hypothetical protein
MSKSNIARRGAPIATALLMALVLAACGGGGGNPGSTGSSAGSTSSTGSTGSTGTVTAAAPASVQFVAAVPADKSIVIKGQGGNGRAETATLTFKVVDINGNPLANQDVNFTLVTPGGATLNADKGKTGADGTVVVTANSGSTPATFRVQATVAGTGGKADLITLSDTITVTTGLPVQKSFSISSNVFNVEGWNIDSSPSQPAARIQVLLADAFSNPVPDGTPIIFQTNVGSIGSADRGGCVTVNGGCSVDFRAQNPRVPTPGQPATPCNTTGSDGKGAGAVPDVNRLGVATICASSTDGTNTLFGRILLTLGTSNPGAIYLDSVNNKVDFSTGVGDLGSVSSSAPRTLSLQLNDGNLNPMPFGTKLEIIDPQGVTVSVPSPATVPNIPLGGDATRDPSGATGYAQGSWHQMKITAVAPTNCTGAQQAAFTLRLTTPGASGATGGAGPTTTDIPFKLSVTCP